MSEKFKYLIHGAEDDSWGLFITVAGTASVTPYSTYPPEKHPTEYHFAWSNGRVLHEYQLNYITEGEGILETRQATYPVKAGSVIVLKPNQWHRYKPTPRTGWKEHYVGFNGLFADTIFSANSLFSENALIQIGYHEDLLHLIQDVVTHALTEKPGYHQICSGLIVQMLGYIYSVKKNKITSSKLENAVQKACLLLRENVDKNLNIEALSTELDISYSLFRKTFKNYTGMSPVQYHLSLKIQQAKYLLTNTDLSVKEIAINLGFCSVYYFSKLFKEKTQRNPSAYHRSKNSFEKKDNIAQ